VAKNKIAVLIPAYNVKYLDDVMQGLKFQTYQDFDIYISDDSPNDEITNRLIYLENNGLLSNLNVTVEAGPKQKLGRLNYWRLDRKYSSEYEFIHFHGDDDYIYPTFYEDHLEAHMHGDFSASLSKRWISNELNTPVGKPINVSFERLNQAYTPLTLEVIAKSSLPYSINWLGELTNCLIKGTGRSVFSLPPYDGNNLNYFGLLDIGTFLDLAQSKNLIYIHSYISNWRRHAEQSTNNIGSHGIRIAVLCWLAFSIKAHNDGLIDENDLISSIERRKPVLKSRMKTDVFFEDPLNLISEDVELKIIKKKFTDWWINFLSVSRSRAEIELIKQKSDN
jgi:glycosyltransferase involved in cell wall biosynthesis